MQYYLLSNLNHDGQEFVRGETIDLEAGSAAAKSLLEAGVISTEAPEKASAESTPVAPEPERKPEVGGKPLETGEPSIDGREEQGASTEAEDVTPQVSERMTRDELEALAREKGIEEQEIEAAPNKGALVDLIVKQPVAPKEPEVDPSANL